MSHKKKQNKNIVPVSMCSLEDLIETVDAEASQLALSIVVKIIIKNRSENINILMLAAQKKKIQSKIKWDMKNKCRRLFGEILSLSD